MLVIPLLCAAISLVRLWYAPYIALKKKWEKAFLRIDNYGKRVHTHLHDRPR